MECDKSLVSTSDARHSIVSHVEAMTGVDITIHSGSWRRTNTQTPLTTWKPSSSSSPPHDAPSCTNHMTLTTHGSVRVAAPLVMVPGLPSGTPLAPLLTVPPSGFSLPPPFSLWNPLASFCLPLSHCGILFSLWHSLATLFTVALHIIKNQPL